MEITENKPLTTMITCQKDKFDLPENITYLNTSYMAAQLKSVDEAGRTAVSRKLRPYTISPQDFFTEAEALKIAYSKLIEVPDSQRVAIIPSASYGLANVANNVTLTPQQKILVLADQFPSNVYVWHKLAEKYGASVEEIEAPDHDLQNRGRLWNEAILNAIDDNTALIALPHVHWAEGIVFDLKAIRSKTKEYGALMIIDGSQSVGAYPFSVADLQPDALICVGYKWLLGGYGLGLGYYGPAFDQGEPIENNWIHRKNSEDFTRLVDYEAEYKPKANRYSMGEVSNFILVPMLLRAIEQINSWGVENIQAYCHEITREFKESVKELGFKMPDGEQMAAHLFSIQVPEGLSVEELKKRFQQEQIFLSFRGNNIRIASHLFNSKQDLDKLLQCLSAIHASIH